MKMNFKRLRLKEDDPDPEFLSRPGMKEHKLNTGLWIQTKYEAVFLGIHNFLKKADVWNSFHLAEKGNVRLFELELNAILASTRENMIAHQNPLFRR